MEEQPLAELAGNVHDWKQDWNAFWNTHANRRSFVITVAILVLGGAFYYQLVAPPNNFPIDELVSISEGMPLGTAANTLQEDGVVQSSLALKITVELMGGQKNVHAGDYLFKEPKNLFQVARAIVTGAFGLEPVRVRIPEGMNTMQMAKILELQLPRFNRAAFLASAKPLEGYLFPDTYFFLPNATEETVVNTMRSTFETKTSAIRAATASSTNSFSDIVIMASILEKEASKTQDRRMIAGVLWNRLQRGMLLQVDAAFIYTLGKGTFQLTMADLASDSPYNTYKYKGLPPTPISSPSLDSLDAALHPIKNSYLFYLADRSGVTHYSKTYEEHLAKKRLYLGT